MDIIESIIGWAKKTPTQIAVSYKDRRITYYELVQRANAVSKEIIQLKKHITQNEQIPIIVLGERGPEFIISLLGVLQSGNYYIPLEMPHSQCRLNQIIGQLNNYILISTNKYDFLEEEKIKFFINYNNIQQDESNKYCGSRLTPSDLCYMIYTSGTKNAPKGVMIRYESLCNLVNQFLKNIYSNIGQSVSVGVLSSFSFDASIKQIFGALCFGHNLVIAQTEDKLFSLRMQHFFEKNKIYIVDGTPSIYKLLMKKEKKPNWKVAYFLIGGEIIKRSFIMSFKQYLDYECVVLNVYGPTECCIDASYFQVNFHELNSDILPIGKPIPNAIFHIHDINGNLIESNGEEGELYISGVLVGDGYFNQPESQNFFNSPEYGKTYKTGDLAIRNNLGEYLILGRIDDQIKINGNRLELCEVEKVISDILCSDTVVCIDKKADGDELYAFVHVNQRTEIIPEQLVVQQARNFLPSYGIPKKIIYVYDDFPLTTNGKVDRSTIIKKYLSN